MSTVIENQSFREGLLIQNQNGLTIRACEFSIRNGELGYAPFVHSSEAQAPCEPWPDGTPYLPPQDYAGYISPQ